MRNEIDELLLEFEREYDASNHAYRGIRYWNLIRVYLPIFVQEAQKTGGPIIAPQQRRTFERRRIVAVWKACLYTLAHPSKMKPADILVAVRHQLRKVDGTYKDWHLDFIQTGYSEQRVSFAQEFFIQDTYKKYPSCCWTYLRFRMTVWFYTQGLRKLDKDELDYIREMERRINARFGIQMHRLEYFITSTLVFYRVFQPFICRVLDKVRPKIILMQNYASITNAMLSEFGRKRGITCIDMQHGVYNDGDLYVSIPTIDYLPRYMFTYGTIYDHYFSLPEGCETVAVGYPYREAMARRYSVRTPNPKGVVFYSYVTDRERYMAFILAFAALSQPLGYQIYFKLRPDELSVGRLSYQTLEQHGITLLDGDMDLYSAIFSNRFHVSFFTTALIEALFEGIYVYLCDYFHQGNGQWCIDEGYMETALTPEALWQKIQNPAAQRRDVDMLWKPNAGETIRTEIARIMRGYETRQEGERTHAEP